MTSDVISSVVSTSDTTVSSYISIETMDTALRLAAIQNRIEVLITIVLSAFVLLVGSVVIYMLYCFIRKFIGRG